MKIDLIPWDPDSSEHIERLIAQREQCGWSAEKVRDPWAQWQREGMRSLFWLVIADESEPNVQEKLAEHFDKNPSYREYLHDTCKAVRLVPRSPTNAKFRPIGHIALDKESANGREAGLKPTEDGTYWIGPLYVAWELQSLGIGRAAMDTAEALVVQPPLNAKALGLDTLAKKHQEDPEYIAAHYEKPPHTTNQGWYERRGFQVFHSADGIYTGPDRFGKEWHRTAVFLKKSLVATTN
ncbi:hypothetical protein B0I35DRAFT_100012 [Stachybotrys elegans]|uniref:N-acetyltransferase domain-containing protein n=1 Tax=Stachybotrys elegans TaxID=80388 RepID=A0A8K0SI55_9HYPO|nr:hypothetical protein B0I35DRAFT_100012 [Stachybotrys elegans]